MSKKSKKVISLILIVIVIFSSWLHANITTNRYIDPVEQLYLEKFQDPLFMVLAYINSFYFEREDVDYDKLLDSTLNGMIAGLDDPFAWYFDAQETQENVIKEEGEYGGLGITVRYDTKTESIVVVSPMDGTPADKAGILANDYIISVDGHKVSEIGYMEAVNKMRGTPGEPVDLLIYRSGWEQEKNISIIRALIETRTVKYTIIQQNNKNIAFVKITNFAKKTAEETKEILQKISKQNVDGIILDLRNNPGGFLDIAIETASMFQKTGNIVSVHYYNKKVDNSTVISGKYFDFMNNLPFVVLVNKGSASASEILTGSFKDNGLAVVVGETTYGKAAVQTTFTLPNEGEIWLPIGQYLTPSGNNIHLKGIEPDYILKNPAREIVSSSLISEDEEISARQATTDKIEVDTDNDLQLIKALEIIYEKLGVNK
jgi:carboxyl-terminal processing protease